MLKLTPDFFITKIQKREKNKIEYFKEYNFKYKNLKIELCLEFRIVGFTDYSNTAIINFGYMVYIAKYSNKNMGYYYVGGIDNKSGKSTKKYFGSKKAREIVVKFIEKSLYKYLKKSKPTLIIFGALSHTEANLPRYKRLEMPFLANGYRKKILEANKYKSLHQIISKKNEKDSKIVWAYAKYDNYFKEFKSVFSSNILI